MKKKDSKCDMWLQILRQFILSHGFSYFSSIFHFFISKMKLIDLNGVLRSKSFMQI